MRAVALILLALTIVLLPFPIQIKPVYATYTLSMSPPSQTVGQGGTVTYIVTVTNSDPGAHTVVLSYRGTIFATVTTPVAAGASTTAILTISTTFFDCPGTYGITVVGTEGAFSTTAAATLVIVATLPPLRLSVSADKTTYRLGDTITISMTVNKPARTRLTIAGPSGSPFTFDITFFSAGTTTRTLTATEPTGVYTVTFTGVYCTETDSATTSFTVTPRTYDVLVSTSGLPPEVSAQLKVDGVATRKINGGEIATLSFELDTRHVVEIDQVVQGSTSVRYFCQNNRFTVSGPTSITFEFITQYFVDVMTDPGGIVSATGGGWYNTGATVSTNAMPPEVQGPPGTRFIFVGWEVDGTLQPGASVTQKVDRPAKLIAKFKTQHLLKVESAYGDPKGSSWYDKGSSARFSVTSPVGLLIQKLFVRWEGDFNGTSPEASIVMDNPKTVRAVWEDSYLQLYALIIGLAAVGGAAAFFLRRRAEGPPVTKPVPGAPETVKPSQAEAVPTAKSEMGPPTPRPPPGPVRRLCVSCGAELDAGQKFCYECGKQQTD